MKTTTSLKTAAAFGDVFAALDELQESALNSAHCNCSQCSERTYRNTKKMRDAINQLHFRVQLHHEFSLRRLDDLKNFLLTE